MDGQEPPSSSAKIREGAERLHARQDATVLSLRLFERLPQNPIVTVNRAVPLLECSRPAAAKALRVLEAAGVLEALDASKKNRAVMFREYLDLLRVGTDSIP